MNDDALLFILRRDLSGGINTRQNDVNIADNQATVLKNVDISIPGETSKRPGATLIQSLSSYSGTGLFGFQPDAGTFRLVSAFGNQLKSWLTTGSSFGSLASHTALTVDTMVNMIKAGESGENDVLMIMNGTDPMLRMNQTPAFQALSNASLGPPITRVATYYRNRLWTVKSNLLAYSDAFPADYDLAFAATNAFRMPVGTERAIIGVRDSGLVILGEDQIWSINPSPTPAATDKPEKLLDLGCVAGDTAVQVGDDIYFMAKDGVRGVFRTQQDKLQLGVSYPVSFVLKDQLDSVNWRYINKACSVFFDNKYFIAIPTGASTYNNQVWVYYPASQGWAVIDGWDVAKFAKFDVGGKETLFYIDSVNAKVYLAWEGFTDAGTAISYIEEGKEEDCGAPLEKKVGGEVAVKAIASGDFDIKVYIALDNGGYNYIGMLNLGAGLVTFPLTFPVTFPANAIVYKKFHIANLGQWYRAKVKLESSEVNTAKITILERQIIAYKTDYLTEDL
jgi:hypothetical protein